MPNIELLTKKINTIYAKLSLLQQDKKEKEKEKKTILKRQEALAKAIVFLQSVAQATQSQLKFHVESIVQTALDACWKNRYEFIMKFEMKRGSTSVEMKLIQEGDEIDPMASTGGGVVDIISFALRLSAWSLSTTRNVIILDEPFRYLSADLQSKAGEILKELSERLNIQIIMVTHNTSMTEIADRIFTVKKNNETLESEVTEKDYGYGD